MFDDLLVPLALLELGHALHAALGMLDDGGGNGDMRRVDGGAAAERVFSRADLEDTVERIYHQDAFAEAWRGLFLIRGENVVLLGEIVGVLWDAGRSMANGMQPRI